MRAFIFGSLFSILTVTGKVYARDCQITWEGTATGGPKKGHWVKVLETYAGKCSAYEDKTYDPDRCEKIAQAVESDYAMIEYWSERKFTERSRRLSPISTRYYIKASKATWCYGRITYLGFSFEKDGACETVEKN